MRSRDGGRYSLRLRVALSTALAAALVGLGSAAVATWLMGRLSTAAQDQRLRDIAVVLREDIEHDGVPADVSVEDEAREVASLGVRLAYFEGGLRRAGSPAVGAMDHDGCFTSQDEDGSAWRTCGLRAPQGRIVVSAADEGAPASRRVLLASIAGAAAFASIVGALMSLFLAKWALSPLTLLTTRLESVSTSAPAESDLGAPSGASEVEALRTTLRSLLQRLGENLTQTRAFAASAAHELRTPLALMTAELDLAAERAPGVAEELLRVRHTVWRLTRLVERLLALASDASPLADVPEAVALEDVVRDVLGTYGVTERERISTAFDAPGMVRGDEALLRVVVDNLVDNALKFDDGGKVHVTVDERDGDAVLDITDEGPGIPSADWARLLRPFERGSGQVRGHGLGLAIAEHVVRRHRGELALVPRSTGAKIRVRLPAWKERHALASD
jgi:signal transduction histidine kinase